MAQSQAIESRTTRIRTTRTFDNISLPLGTQIAKLVDAVYLSNGTVSVTAQHTPTAEDPNPQKIRVGGTPEQIDVFSRALSFYETSVAEGFTDKALSDRMGFFVSDQIVRYHH
jgi:hypothetical protein